MSVPTSCHAERVSALFVFDMDGTLLPGTTASVALAATLGAGDRLHDLDARFAAGDLDTRGFAAEVHDLFAPLTPCRSRRRSAPPASSTGPPRSSPTSGPVASARS